MEYFASTHLPGIRNDRRSTKVMLALLAAVVLVASPAGAASFGFAGMSTSDTLAVLDLDAGTDLGKSIDLLPDGNYPYDATIHPSGHEVWVCGASGDGVVVVDTRTHTVVTRIDLSGIAEYPVNVAFNFAGDLAYISCRDPVGAVVVVDTATYAPTGDTVAITDAGKGRVDMVTGEIFVVEWYDSWIHAIDPATLIPRSADIAVSLWDLAIHPSGSPVYAIDRGTDQMHVVDPSNLSVITSVSVGDDSWGIDITPDGSTILVANEDSSNVTVIDTATNTVTTTIPLAADAKPRDVDILLDGSAAYVPTGSISGDDGVYVIDMATLAVIDTIFITGDSNSNVVAVAPEPFNPLIFADGFESGDTGEWSTTVLPQ